MHMPEPAEKPSLLLHNTFAHNVHCNVDQVLPLMLCTHSPPYSRSSPASQAVAMCEDVPMDANPAYGEVNVYDTVKDRKGN